jgi:hypothetical protein
LKSTQKGQELINSLGGDKDIQNEVAELYKERSVINIDKLKSLLESKGIKVSTEWVNGVNHMADQKAVGIGNTQVSDGLTVITFEKDGKTFKVADANGNAALESEELLFNEILSGVNSDLSAMVKADSKLESTEDVLEFKSKSDNSDNSTKNKANKESEISSSMDYASMLSLYDEAAGNKQQEIADKILSSTGYDVETLRRLVSSTVTTKPNNTAYSVQANNSQANNFKMANLSTALAGSNKN